MSDVGAARRAYGGEGRGRDKLIGVYIAVLAVGLAVCSLGGGNATKIATLKNIEAANTWAFFQAKNLRRQVVRIHADELELLLARESGLPDAARAATLAKINAYRDLEKHLTSEPDKKEGMDELFVRGKALEVERDRAMRQDPYFDYAQALLQIAIVLASVAILAGGSFLLWVSGALGVLGALLTVNGFTLLAKLPLIG